MKLVVFVDQHLKSPQRWVQVAHCCYLAGARWGIASVEHTFVVLALDGKRGLEAVRSRAIAERIQYVTFYESYFNAHTAIALQPMAGVPDWVDAFDLLT